MKTVWSKARVDGFSLIELLCVIAVIAVLAGLLLPALSQGRARANRAACLSNLRETGLGFQAFSHDHNSQFPMAVSTNAGGASELVQTAYLIQGQFYFSFRLLQSLSNELVTPKLLACPSDTRLPAANFGAFDNSKLSYFVGVTADYNQPNSILAGDRNLTNDWVAAASILHLGPGQRLRWIDGLHQFKGDLLYADGRVEQRNSPALATANNQGQSTADLFMPSVVASDAGTSLSGSGAPAGGASSWSSPAPTSQRGTDPGKISAQSNAPPTNSSLLARQTSPWTPAPANPPMALGGQPGSGANSGDSQPSSALVTPPTQTTNSAETVAASKAPNITGPTATSDSASAGGAAPGQIASVAEEPEAMFHWPFYLLLLLLLLGVLSLCLGAWGKRKQLT
jgi:prepilin-type N-terminal cleavage/methylation domain-containing protein